MATAARETLIILGAGGDLTSRLLLPGLASLLASSRGAHMALIGVDREPMTDAAWQKKVRTAFADAPSSIGTSVLESSRYLQGDATSADDLQRALDAAEGRVVLYFALPPAIAAAACAALASVTLPTGVVLALEKPFGTDAASARALNRLLETLVPEEQVFRVDHFLGKSTVLGLLGLRFANRLFEPLMSAEHIERVEVIFDERLGLEGRAGYYDHAGALTDMIQSHLLLVLALAAMEVPSDLSSEVLRGGMVQLLRAVRPWKHDGTASRRARYTAGDVEGRELPSYLREPGVDRTRGTETLAEMAVAIDNWRWAGVPFILRSGKAIGNPRQEIIITLKPVPHLPDGFTGPARDARIRIGLKPPVLDIDLAVNGGADPFKLEWDTLSADFEVSELSAYGEVLAELLEGDPTLSVRGDVAEQCWRIVAPVLAAWRRDAVELDTYQAGSANPRGWSRPLA
ncbi:glucose-6-phosphate dehydrogenase [Leifsonia sp. YIM 134122]|uniref:Glucose-6-phosphate dehydrogenase n=1 Tax=Leifsonia stereocauli TaxID=3134136 RepID=A0ABU9W0U0_9MICO